VDPVRLLTQPEGILLRDVKYGVVRGVYRSTDSQPGAFTSITGQVVKVDRKNGNLTINGAHIVHADILTSAAVVPVVDNVMDPTESSASIDPNLQVALPQYTLHDPKHPQTQVNGGQ
jgi:uncharacterized surface protein with fasciclin (FAS1) repeats